MTSPIILFFTALLNSYIYTLSLHDALPIFLSGLKRRIIVERLQNGHEIPELLMVLQRLMDQPLALLVGLLRKGRIERSEEHTSELQSHSDLVCRLLLEKKKEQDV